MKTKFFQPAVAAFSRFSAINKNPANSYLSGYEDYFRAIPKISNGDDHAAIQMKLKTQKAIIRQLAMDIYNEDWIYGRWPDEGSLYTRTILAIEENGTHELLLARWNFGSTPIHGHRDGQMIDFVVRGNIIERSYEIEDREKRTVSYIGEKFRYFGEISSEYHSGGNYESMIHKLEFITQSITLHIVPSHPLDGNGNLFTEVK